LNKANNTGGNTVHNLIAGKKVNKLYVHKNNLLPLDNELQEIATKYARKPLPTRRRKRQRQRK